MKSNKFSYIRNEIMIQAKHKNNVVSPIIIKLLFWRFLCAGSCFTLFLLPSSLYPSVTETQDNDTNRFFFIFHQLFLKKGFFLSVFCIYMLHFFFDGCYGMIRLIPRARFGAFAICFHGTMKRRMKTFQCQRMLWVKDLKLKEAATLRCADITSIIVASKQPPSKSSIN